MLIRLYVTGIDKGIQLKYLEKTYVLKIQTIILILTIFFVNHYFIN